MTPMVFNERKIVRRKGFDVALKPLAVKPNSTKKYILSYWAHNSSIQIISFCEGYFVYFHFLFNGLKF